MSSKPNRGPISKRDINNQPKDSSLSLNYANIQPTQHTQDLTLDGNRLHPIPIKLKL